MKRLILAILLVACLAGCATVDYIPGDAGRLATPGVYHEVRRGETLWDISKIYGVSLREIINFNRLPNASKIEIGQLIFVPGIHDAAAGKRYAGGKKTESFIWPVRGVVVSYFGSMKNMIKNKGIDIEAPEGINVLASRGGRVTFTSNHLKGYGKTIIIDHLDGFQTVYAHSSDNFVEVDQRVEQNAVIARVGKTGRVNKPTLHFEIRKKHKPQNPFYYLP
jgi:murein DD-endopeptidase MepM/ murein hydrolase activator NlpD